MSNNIQWINALSTLPSLEAAISEIVDKIKKNVSTIPDLGIIFISSAYASEYPRLMPLLLDKLPLPIVIGCGGGGIIGMKNSQEVLEIEGNPAISLTVANLSEIEITPFYVSGDELPDLDSPPQAWSELIGVAPEKNPQFILLSDPFGAKINDLIEGLDYAYPGCVKIGGLASAGSLGYNSTLFYYDPKNSDQLLYHEGTVGIAFSGNIIIETIVAQGCRPIGETYRITQGERNLIIELEAADGKTDPPLLFLRNLVEYLSEKDRQLAQTSLFIGIARDEFKLKLEQRDFLIRNLLGIEPRMGAMAVGDRIRPGQRIQFHLRDATTSAEDLENLLKNYQQERENTLYPKGALMFSCVGRGEGLYGTPNFDSELFCRYFKNIPLGGFFCNGEIGPVAGRTFLHGYTSAFGIFRELVK